MRGGGEVRVHMVTWTLLRCGGRSHTRTGLYRWGWGLGVGIIHRRQVLLPVICRYAHQSLYHLPTHRRRDGEEGWG